MTSIMQLARDEREDFAALLEGLTMQQWQSQSLCDRWRVHEVVAHAIGYDPLNCRQLVRRFAKGAVTSGGANAVGVTEFAGKSPQELVSLVRQYAEPRGLTTGFGGRIAFTDGMIHQQDIRRPLGIPRAIPAERLRTALDFARWAPPLRGAWRARGVRLVAADLAVEPRQRAGGAGAGEALLMAMAGRRAALADLDGPGKGKLAQRI